MSEEELPQFGDYEASKAKMRSKFLEKTLDEWVTIFKPLDACVAPVLELEEAAAFPHNAANKAFGTCSFGVPSPVFINSYRLFLKLRNHSYLKIYG